MLSIFYSHLVEKFEEPLYLSIDNDTVWSGLVHLYEWLVVLDGRVPI